MAPTLNHLGDSGLVVSAAIVHTVAITRCWRASASHCPTADLPWRTSTDASVLCMARASDRLANRTELRNCGRPPCPCRGAGPPLRHRPGSRARLGPVTRPLNNPGRAPAGNLIEPLSLWQAFGIWPVGDFRIDPVDTAVTGILIAGTDQMAFFASYLRHLLMLLDVRAEIAASPSQEALSRLGRIDESTLVIGLSAGRPSYQ